MLWQNISVQSLLLFAHTELEVGQAEQLVMKDRWNALLLHPFNSNVPVKMDNLRFYVLSNSISVISGRWADDKGCLQ